MHVCEVSRPIAMKTCTDACGVSSTAEPTPSGTKKRRRKKQKLSSYRDIMNTVLAGSESTDSHAREEQRERIRRNLGGGAFSKLDRI